MSGELVRDGAIAGPRTYASGRRFFAGVRARLMLLAAFCTLPAFGILFYSARLTDERNIEKAKADLQAHAASAAAELEADIRSAAVMLRALSRIPTVADLKSPQCLQDLRRIVAADSRFANVNGFTPTGEFVCSGLPISAGVNVADRDYFLRALASDEVIVGEPVTTRLRGRPVLPVAVAVRDPLGKPKSVLSVNLNLEKFADRVTRSAVEPNTVMTLWDGRAKVVFRWPDLEQVTGKTFSELPTGREITSRPSGYFEALGLDGARRIVGFASVPGWKDLNLKLSFSLPLDSLHAPSREALRRNVRLLVALMALSFVIAWSMAEVMVRRRLIALAYVAERMKAGDLHVRTQKPYPPDEFGVLARSFDEMADTLHLRELELKKLNAELEQRVADRTRELEEAVKELESFSYSVSHDLRAPLRHMQGYAEMLRPERDRLSGEARRYLDSIGRAAARMSRLIDDLLAFSRVGRSEMAVHPVGLNEVVTGVIESLEAETRGRNLVWKVAELPAVVGNRPMLVQLMANLLGNAVKYTRPREPGEIEIGWTGEGEDRIIVFVRDNGVGFDMRYASKLFGVFQRLHRSDEFEGTGIGLAIVRRVAHRHGGRVWAESVPDKGSTFYFTLPRAK